MLFTGRSTTKKPTGCEGRRLSKIDATEGAMWRRTLVNLHAFAETMARKACQSGESGGFMTGLGSHRAGMLCEGASALALASYGRTAASCRISRSRGNHDRTGRIGARPHQLRRS